MSFKIFVILIALNNGGHYFNEITSYNTICDVTKYGAKGDGTHDDTSGIQKAINDCINKGSSAQILFPEGYKFLSFPIFINKTCNNCAVTIEKNCQLIANNDRSKWPDNTDFINIKDVTNFVFEGPGLIEGQGQIWWENRNDFRPRIMYAKGSHVIVRSFTLQNCPNHCLELYTDYTQVYGITILNPPSVLPDSNAESHNTDGIDVHGQPFYVHNCVINTGDDNVAIHANDTLIEDCSFGSGHGASIGSLGGGWLTNITVNRVNFTGTTPGARIKVHNNAGPGRLWNVVYSNLNMYDVSQTIVLTEYYDGSSNEDCKFNIDHITFENITSYQNNTKYDVGTIMCQKTATCKDIYLKNIKITGGIQSWECQDASVSASNTLPSWKGC